jgi:hypothetical protein
LENITLIDYNGRIKYETIGELIHKFKLQVPLLGIPIGIYKRILLIMIESLENIMKHSDGPDSPQDDLEVPSLSISLLNNQFLIKSSNPVDKANIQVLRERIDLLNHMDAQELKNIYKETITNGVFSKTGGAGLGLIEMAKISGNPIQYEFKPINNQYYRYIQLVTVNT